MRFLLIALLMLGTQAFAQPTLSPSSGVISQVNQEFVYQTNGSSVDRFTLWIGTAPTGDSARDIVDTGSLGAADGTYIVPFLPTGTVFVRLRYRIAGVWGTIENSYAVSDDDPVNVALLNELGCSVGEIIRVTSSGWECVDSGTLAGPDYADELCDVFRYSGANPPSSLLCPSDDDRYAFVTQSTHNGEIGGVQNADAICQMEADQASLPGVYKAFLSEEYTPIATRLKLLNGVTYKKTNNATVASSLDQIFDQNVNLTAPVDRHANGNLASGETRVWTGRIFPGGPNDCNAWTGSNIQGSTSVFAGTYGQLNEIDDDWSSATGTTNALRCTNEYRLYCFEM